MNQLGRQLADEGGRRALSHAERENMTWGERAYRAILYCAERHPFITIEEVKAFAYSRGLPRPPAEGAWGPVTKRAIKADVITFERYCDSKNASQHGKPIKVWRVK